MPVSDVTVAGTTPWGDFGRRLKYFRRRAGLTQHQLGLRMGYHHSLISKWESGLRELPAELVRHLDSVLGTGGELAAIVAGERVGAEERRTRSPLDPALFAPMPGGRGPHRSSPPVPGDWPSRLSPRWVRCPLHGAAECPVPALDDLPALLAEVHAAAVARVPVAVDPEVVHALAGLLDRCLRTALHTTSTAVLGTVEQVLRALVGWAQAVNAAGKLPYEQLWLAARYAQLAGRLRMHREQSGIAMAWFGHGLRWAEACQDLPARAVLLAEMCTLARLDGDGASALGYAQALAVLDGRRTWIGMLAHAYQARGCAVLGEGPEARRRIALSRRSLVRLDQRDLDEAPWLAGCGGELRVESAAGGALRDLAAATGDRATARRAVEATLRALDQVPAEMLPARLLLTVRLADGYACAGDPAAALAVVAPALEQAVPARRLTVARELTGLTARLASGWGELREVREFRERVRELAGGQR
ncbi:hypothetical protein ACZ90_24825 [Streptomyces albus subsp. albus]|nr:hypothetical protein ACZ90_24825 [Streptomyces albus subsp. albus]